MHKRIMVVVPELPMLYWGRRWIYVLWPDQYVSCYANWLRCIVIIVLNLVPENGPGGSNRGRMKFFFLFECVHSDPTWVTACSWGWMSTYNFHEEIQGNSPRLTEWIMDVFTQYKTLSLEVEGNPAKSKQKQKQWMARPHTARTISHPQ